MTASVVQTILLLAMVGPTAYLVADRRRARAKAGVKLGFVVSVIMCLRVTVRPGGLTAVANWIGVTRGIGLLLHVLVLALMFTTVPPYIRFREQELRCA